MAVLAKRLKDAENKLIVPDDSREEEYINGWIEYWTTGNEAVFATPAPPGKSLFTYYHMVKERMKKQSLEMHPSIRERIDREIRESRLSSSKEVNHVG